LLIALGVGVLVATGAAGAVSWLVARRLAAPVQDVATAAEGLADGHPGEPVTDPGLGPEFATLTGSMNRLSRRLRDVEQTRRRLTADLAHQLRTPLASVRATAEALADGVLPADPPTLAVLTEQTDRLLRLVADLEQVSRAEERHLVLHPAPQPLGPLVERSVATAHAGYRAKSVALHVTVEPAAPRVRIDADRVAEALTNLLDNALRHTPSGGTVTVSVRPDPSGRGATVTVEDTGAGFDPDQAERLFERFHRGPGAEPSTGTGLGLTIARAIVESHGGRLTAASSGPGHGATFSVTLPAAIG
jgi:signal transduction histidine kinase